MKGKRLLKIFKDLLYKEKKKEEIGRFLQSVENLDNLIITVDEKIRQEVFERDEVRYDYLQSYLKAKKLLEDTKNAISPLLLYGLSTKIMQENCKVIEEEAKNHLIEPVPTKEIIAKLDNIKEQI